MINYTLRRGAASDPLLAAPDIIDPLIQSLSVAMSRAGYYLDRYGRRWDPITVTVPATAVIKAGQVVQLEIDGQQKKGMVAAEPTGAFAIGSGTVSQTYNVVLMVLR